MNPREEVKAAEYFPEKPLPVKQGPRELKKKKLCVTIQSSCLTLQLRTAEGDLIAEFCMVNFDYGLETYANGIVRIYFNAYSLFILHDEDRLTMTKQVMFGHVNASNQMVTTEDFYKTLPDRIR